jgi:serine/threonine protein kinase
MLDRIHQTLGTPHDAIAPFRKRHSANASYRFEQHDGRPLSYWCPHLEEAGLDLLARLLSQDPNTRIDASSALNHRYFESLWAPQTPTCGSVHQSSRAGSTAFSFVA